MASEIDTLYGILHPERQESFDNLVNGLACHYERLGKKATGVHAADKYTLEYVAGQLESLMQAREAQASKQADIRGRIDELKIRWLGEGYMDQHWQDAVDAGVVDDYTMDRLAALNPVAEGGEG
jgi:hypothetical protein